MFCFLDYFLRHPFKPSLSDHSPSNLSISNPSLGVGVGPVFVNLLRSPEPEFLNF
jgi:hypothetical protein